MKPTNEELQAALSDLKKVSCDFTALKWFEKYANTDNSLVMQALKFTMAANEPSKNVCLAGERCYDAKCGDYWYNKSADECEGIFTAMTAKIWEEIE